MTTVAVTRPKPAVDNSATVYREAGFDTLLAPCFDVVTNPSVRPDWLQIPADVWIILSVHALQHALLIDPAWHPPKQVRVIAVGPAVVKAWQAQFGHPIESHPMMNSEGVIELLRQDPPQSVKILTTHGGRETIRSHCLGQAISYHQINSYHLQPLAVDFTAVFTLTAGGEAVVLTATSVGILQQLHASIPQSQRSVVCSWPLVVGSMRIAQAAEQLGFTAVHTAASPRDADMCQAVASFKR